MTRWANDTIAWIGGQLAATLGADKTVIARIIVTATVKLAVHREVTVIRQVGHSATANDIADRVIGWTIGHTLTTQAEGSLLTSNLSAWVHTDLCFADVSVIAFGVFSTRAHALSSVTLFSIGALHVGARVRWHHTAPFLTQQTGSAWIVISTAVEDTLRGKFALVRYVGCVTSADAVTDHLVRGTVGDTFALDTDKALVTEYMEARVVFFEAVDHAVLISICVFIATTTRTRLYLARVLRTVVIAVAHAILIVIAGVAT